MSTTISKHDSFIEAMGAVQNMAEIPGGNLYIRKGKSMWAVVSDTWGGAYTEGKADTIKQALVDAVNAIQQVEQVFIEDDVSINVSMMGKVNVYINVHDTQAEATLDDVFDVVGNDIEVSMARNNDGSVDAYYEALCKPDYTVTIAIFDCYHH